MRKKNYRGVRCIKRELGKCEGICRSFDKLQTAFADLLQADESVVSFRCNVLLEGVADDLYTSDFVAVKDDGSLMVRECVFRKNLMRPTMARLLDISRNYWMDCGVTDWGIVVEKLRKEDPDED